MSTEAVPPGDAAVLRAAGMWAGYGGVPCVRDLSLEVHPGEIVVVLGPNGAGKTTTLLTLSGALPVLQGQVFFRGRPTTAPLHVRVREGLGLVPEERSIVSKLSTVENLRLGQGPVQEALELFPELRSLLRRRAGLLSGGEQRILSMARALASRPSVLLADELSLGLAPKIVSRLMTALKEAAGHGAGVLLVEQHARQALAIADKAFVLSRGSLVWSGSAQEARDNLAEIESAYLGRAVESRRGAASPDGTGVLDGP